MNKLNLEILTPYGKYFSGEVDAIKVQSEDFLMEILPNHSQLVSSLVVSKMYIINGNRESPYAIGSGVVRVNKGKTTLLLNSIEAKSEIDIERALKAKQRAEERLKNKSNIDVKRAQLALQRALVRIEIHNS